MRMVMRMKWLQTTYDVYDGLQKQTKTMLRFCGSYLYMIVLCAIAMRICAGGLMEYYTALAHCGELLQALRPCVGVTALGALLTEAAGKLLQT